MAAPSRMTERHKRLPELALEGRRRFAAHLRAAVCRLTTEEIRLALGDNPKNAGQLRRDIGDIRSGRPERAERIGEKRYYAFCAGLGVDPWAALSGAPAPTLPARVH